MKVVNKVMVELTGEEYTTLIKAQNIIQKIGDKLDQESVCTDEIGKLFDDYQKSLMSIVSIIKEGITREEDEDENN